MKMRGLSSHHVLLVVLIFTVASASHHHKTHHHKHDKHHLKGSHHHNHNSKNPIKFDVTPRDSTPDTDKTSKFHKYEQEVALKEREFLRKWQESRNELKRKETLEKLQRILHKNKRPHSDMDDFKLLLETIENKREGKINVGNAERRLHQDHAQDGGQQTHPKHHGKHHKHKSI